MELSKRVSRTFVLLLVSGTLLGLVQSAHAEPDKQFAYVTLGGVALAIPRQWVLDPHKRWGAGIRSQPRRKGILLDALNSGEPIVINRLQSCCRKNRLEPLFPDRAPYFIGLTAGDPTLKRRSGDSFTAIEFRTAKSEGNELFPGFWRSINPRIYFFQPPALELDEGAFRRITCPDKNMDPPAKEFFACDVTMTWRESIGVKYMFRRSRFPLEDFAKLDATVIKLLDQLEQWARQGGKP